jgi:hypothetical protein
MGGILLENETGGADWVTARDLALITSVTTSLRLVFLNSCSTAALAARSHMHLAASVGPSLALCGVPAVVGMVSAIGDRVAVTFANSVYTRLRDGATLEAAVHAARIAMRLDPINGESWTIPVVFSRMTQGQATARPAPERPTVTDNPVNHSALASPSYDIKAKFGIMRVKNLAVGHHGRDAPVGGSAEQVRIDFDAGETEADNVTIGGIGSGPGNTRS